jgi:hypothetical protein
MQMLPGFTAEHALVSTRTQRGGRRAARIHTPSQNRLLPSEQKQEGFLQGLDNCYQRACESTNNIWVEGGCARDPSLSLGQSAAAFAAWQIEAQACWWGGLGKTLIGIFK